MLAPWEFCSAAEFCRACGAEIGKPANKGWINEFLGLAKEEKIPEFLDTLCMYCLHQISREVPGDNEGYPTRRVIEADLDTFLASYANLIACRVFQKLPIDLCEVIEGWYAVNERCHRFASQTIPADGKDRRVCSGHAQTLKRGSRTLAFIGTHEHQPKPVVIWTRSREELLEECGKAMRRLYGENIKLKFEHTDNQLFATVGPL